ncbi:MAG: hypothetical protein ACI84C_001417 [Flavobacteriales bacterium]|jgi:hypothetical protein
MKEDFLALDELVANNFSPAYTYEEYLQLIEKLHSEDRATGENQSVKFVEFSKLNEHRMKRIHRKQRIDTDLIEKIESIKTPYTWLVITESWCGDAAQNLPILEKLAAYSDLISTKYLLRDENPQIMDLFLTNGGKSIPIVVCLDKMGKVVFRWGPRPSAVQERVLAYKHALEPKPSYDELAKETQLWYAKNKGAQFQEEWNLLVELLN